MTIVTDKGFKIGEVYKVVSERNTCFRIGDCIKFIADDGSDIVRFERIGDGKEAYSSLDDLEKTVKEKPDSFYIMQAPNFTEIRVDKHLSSAQLNSIIKIIKGE